MREITIARDDSGQRLDRFVRKLLPSATLGHVFKLLRTGKVKVNGKRAKPDARLVPGDVVALHLRDDRLEELGRSRSRGAGAGAGGPLAVLYRDDHVLAVDKPPGLLVQPGMNPDEQTLEARVRLQLGPSGAHTFEPSLAHRLDRDTSGVVLVGVSAEGLRGLTEAFRKREVKKGYLALVEGEPPADEFVVDEPLLKERSSEGQPARVRVTSAPGSQPARTDVTVLRRSRSGRFSLLEARPRTGRTHQIRVHLRARGLAIVGDAAYGRPAVNREALRRAGLVRQFLHAAWVELDHPLDSNRLLRIESPVPDDLLRALDWAGVLPPGRRGGGRRT